MSLKRFLCREIPTQKRSSRLPENEIHHALKVYRLQNGDLVEVMDGLGNAVIAKLRHSEDGVWLDYVRPSELAASAHQDSSTTPIILEMAILKGDAMEWVIEKATELGCDEVIPMITERSVVQVDRKGPAAFQERWQKIADQALKQCGRTKSLEIALPRRIEDVCTQSPSRRTNGPPGKTADMAKKAEPGVVTTFSDSQSVSGSPAHHCQIRLWADEAELGAPRETSWIRVLDEVRAARNVSAIRIMIGPEGGWSERERVLIQQASSPEVLQWRISLGPLVLRAETAGIALLGTVRFLLLSAPAQHP